MIRLLSSSDTRAIERLVNRGAGRDAALERQVARIVRDVRRRGDRAVLEYARRYDLLTAPLEVTPGEIARGAAEVSGDLRRAIGLAARHIRRVAARQIPQSGRVRVTGGVTIERRVTALDRVGCYVPGGRYPLPSSLLMTAIPARMAGVREVVAVCARPVPAVLAAAREAGVDRLFRVGGAHAVAALAYGTRAIPRVDKIVGPGNAWVSAAKAQVAADCAIDFYAGPSEILIVAERGEPDWIARDLLAQAEHDPQARAVLVTPNRRLAASVARRVAALVRRHLPARAALTRFGAIVLTRSLEEAVDLANRIAPEHLVCDRDSVAARVTTAGTTFVGRWSAQAAGDYTTGSNHVLPTAGAARFRGGLSAADFVRVTAVQRITRAGLARIGPAAIALAEAEGLRAHASSISVRLTS